MGQNAVLDCERPVMVTKGIITIMNKALFAGLLLACTLSAQANAETGAKADARILIDVSGSMHKNDPQNLRRPALRLLVGLLPDDARAGVWTFGQYVNMLIPLGQVDAGWKRKARAEAAKIASPGQFTNIEDVIRRASADWEGPATIYRRHLILLTDGVVDISKDPKKNAASRKRILEELLPKLKLHNAALHTIALSERADHELMQTLSRETGGWYEQVNNAEQLQRIFLKIFEKVGRPDTVPLKDNKFLVDNSIQEVTLLVFRKEGAEPTQVITPSGEQFDAKSAPKSVSWHRDVGYDMLTITKPETGEWRVQAALDPDNRVIIVTDLKMISSQLPSRFVLGESLPLTVNFSNQGKQITRKDFLDVVNLKSGHVDANGAGEERPILDDGKDGDEVSGDGNFTLRVGEGLAAGKVELIVTAQGNTFQREQRQLFELADPMVMKVQPSAQGEAEWQVSLIPDGEVVDLDSLELNASLISKTGEEQPVMLLPGIEQGMREARINADNLLGDWTLSVSVKGRTRAGSALDLTLDPVAIEGKAAPPPPPPPEPIVEMPPKEEPVVEPPPPPSEPEVVKEEDDFMFQVAIFGGANLLLILTGAGLFWFIRRRKGKPDFQLEEENENQEAAAK
ncbi:MAG: VWA domain-containing protein [Sedimenticola selenatireducens]|uniref:VWA domain-containing protein n=2 Tax=Sedimenticola selenatireducens TaxID=191960 RepID=A0A557SDN0_9GAMM|nr:VWA domain-containing protein [Sedimenticola selenatireducens]TVT65424.1 MAG: VWA domain-containing protein [Sedimenticola selenatireducens]